MKRASTVRAQSRAPKRKASGTTTRRGHAAAAAPELIDRLRRSLPDAKIALEFSSPLELLVATILSAQCTDARVNIVTRDLFARYRTAADYAAADPGTLEGEIHSTGFFRNKAKAIRGMAQALVERHGGIPPRSMDELTALPGVGRKTANVILGNAYGIPGLVVDTHVSRVAARLGLTSNTDPEKIEADLCGVFPRSTWTEVSHLFIHHGRRVCNARTPLCAECVLLSLCPAGARNPRGASSGAR